MKNKGFTLIELLAVIIILAIIALIAVPTIVNIIEKSKMKALENTAYGLIRAGEYYYLKNSNKNCSETFDGPNYEGLKFKGKKVEGSLTINPDGKIRIDIYDNGYHAQKDYSDNKVTVEKGSKPEDSETTGYSIGNVVYYNPTSGAICSSSEYLVSNINSGCMRWHVVKDNGETVDVILDHNTTSKIAWNPSRDNSGGPITVTEQLEADVSGWASGAKTSARLISADEIAEITGVDSALQWESTKKCMYYGYGYHSEESKEVTDMTTQISYFYFDGAGNDYSGWQTQVANSSNLSKYYWLYDNTSGCAEYGCKTDNPSTYGETTGYWTASPLTNHLGGYDRPGGYNAYSAWVVHSYGRLDYYDVDSSNICGVRPVITIPKA